MSENVTKKSSFLSFLHLPNFNFMQKIKEKLKKSIELILRKRVDNNGMDRQTDGQRLIYRSPCKACNQKLTSIASSVF